MEYGFAVGSDYRIGMNIDVTITFLFYFIFDVFHTQSAHPLARRWVKWARRKMMEEFVHSSRF